MTPRAEPAHTVVIVDDIVELRYLVRILLANVRGCRVVAEGETGADAVALAAELRPAVMILDVEMPGMSGMEALPRVLAASPQTKVIMFSSRHEPEVERDVLAQGAFRFLRKGMDPYQVVQAVREAVARDEPARAA